MKLKRREDNAFWKALASIERVVIIIAAIGTTLVVGGACILRAFNINFAGFEEILVLIAFWLYMVGCAYGSYEKSQITADIIEVMMKENLLKEIIRIIRSFLTLALGAIMLWWALQLVMWTIGMDTRTPVYRLPVVFGQSSMLIGLVLVTFYNVVYFIDDVKGFIGRVFMGKASLPTNAEGGAE